MFKKRSESDYVITFPLKVEKWQADILDQRYKLLCQLYNYAQTQLMRKYKWITQKKEYKECKNKKEKEHFFKNNACPMTFNEYGICAWVEKLRMLSVGSNKTYKDFGINAQILGVLGRSVWQAWEKYIYDSDCDHISFKKQGGINSIGLRKKNGKFAGFELDFHNMTISININGHERGQAKFVKIPIITHDNQKEYELSSLHKDDIDNIRMIRIVRNNIRGKNKYYLQLTLEGRIPCKGHLLGKGRVGLDIGPRTVAVCSNTRVAIKVLADKCENHQKKINSLQRAMERSSRNTTPQNYDEKGKYKPKNEQIPWNNSKRHEKLHSQVKELYRKLAATRKLQHILLANELIPLGELFIVEDNPYNSWSSRKKETVINPKTHRPMSKRRWGRSIANCAPGYFIKILKNKVEGRGGKFEVVSCKNAATQYDFTCNKFVKHDIKEREIALSNGNIHQRDLIAAFNLQHIDYSKDRTYHIEAMEKDYPIFCKLEKDQ